MLIPFLNLMGADDEQRLLPSDNQDASPAPSPSGHSGVAPAYAGVRGLGSSLICKLDPDDDDPFGDEDAPPLDLDGVQRKVRGRPRGTAPSCKPFRQPPPPESLLQRSGLWRRRSIVRNLTLLTIGAALYAFGAQGIVAHGGFLTGGLYGLGILAWRSLGWLEAPTFFLFLNIPFFILGWMKVGRRLFFYSLYGTILTAFFSEFMNFGQFVNNQLYAAVAAGAICGTGAGIMLRSLGSGEGLDILAIVLNRRWGVGIGQTYLMFNALLFAAGLFFFSPDMIIASFIQIYITAFTLEKTISMFSQRKLILIVSDNNKEIARRITRRLGVGATFLKAQGAYWGSNRQVLMTVANNLQLKRLEEIVFDVDHNALFIVENTFAVRGHRPFKIVQ